MDKKIFLTKDGATELQKEYDDLIKKRRPEVLDRVSQARNMGDLSENAEYTAAREELSFIDGRIDELEEILKSVELIREDNSRVSSKAIKLGSKVMLNHDNKKEEFILVGEWEADPTEKKISHESPLGKELIGKKVGDVVEVTAPAGKILYKIINVR